MRGTAHVPRTPSLRTPLVPPPGHQCRRTTHFFGASLAARTSSCKQSLRKLCPWLQRTPSYERKGRSCPQRNCAVSPSKGRPRACPCPNHATDAESRSGRPRGATPRPGAPCDTLENTLPGRHPDGRVSIDEAASRVQRRVSRQLKGLSVAPRCATGLARSHRGSRRALLLCLQRKRADSQSHPARAAAS